jgi:hypothetical protein
MGPGGQAMRDGVDAPGGWGTLLDLFKARAEQGHCPVRRDERSGRA